MDSDCLMETRKCDVVVFMAEWYVDDKNATTYKNNT